MKVENKVKAIKVAKSYGSLHLNSKDTPGVKDLTIGEKKTITIEVEITGLRKPDRWEIQEEKMNPNDVKVNMEIRKVVLPSKNKSTDS